MAVCIFSCSPTLSGGCCEPSGCTSTGCATESGDGDFCGDPLPNDNCGNPCGTESNAGASTWSAWSCGGCNNPGGCGNVAGYQDCTRTNQCGGTETMTQSCGGFCNECGPYYGAWSACTAPTFSRSRTYTYDCAGGGTQSETCYSTIYGTLFDASVITTCNQALIDSQPAITSTGITATATVNHTTAYPTTTDGSGDFTRGSLLTPDAYDLTYSVDPDLYVTDPPKMVCNLADATGVSLTGISLTQQGQTAQRLIGLWRIYGGWFQAEGGDVYGHTSIIDTIPATCILAENQATCGSFDSGGTTYTPMISAGTAGATPGIAFTGAASIEMGGAPNSIVSVTNQQSVDTEYDARNNDYTFYTNLTSGLSRGTWSGVGKPSGSASNVYKSAGTYNVDFSLAAAEVIVLLHDGDLTVTGNIDVPKGSYLAIIASGSITFASNVTQAEGVFIANSLTIASTGDDATDQQFVGEGTFVGWSSISLTRDRGLTNNSAPAERFVFRPDFVINAPTSMRTPKITWQEVNP